MIAQVLESGIELRLGEEATVDKVKALSPCGVFIACGARPFRPPVPGIDGQNVVLAEDVLLGQLEGVTTEAWTQRQVDRHSEHSKTQLLAIWSNTFENFKALLPKIPQPTISQFVFDQVTHEHDIRHAISQPGARDSRAISVAEGFIRDFITRNPDPAVHALAESTVTGFDYVRSFSGRRSKEQLAKLGLPADLVAAFISTSPFEMPARSIVE
jgi:hypothetical protein